MSLYTFKSIDLYVVMWLRFDLRIHFSSKSRKIRAGLIFESLSTWQTNSRKPQTDHHGGICNSTEDNLH